MSCLVVSPVTGCVVVASWINLQYFASTVDNRTFGCGTKALHNRVGTHGVVLLVVTDPDLPRARDQDPERVSEPRRVDVKLARVVVCEYVGQRQVVGAVGVIVDRSGNKKPDFGCPFVSLVEMNVENFAADKLPPDLAKTPAVKPGSK